MSIVLTPDQQDWIAAHVERGDFPSIEEAALRLIDESIAARVSVEADDLAWAKPLVDDALADVARGEVMSLAEHRARMDKRLTTLKDQ